MATSNSDDVTEASGSRSSSSRMGASQSFASSESQLGSTSPAGLMSMPPEVIDMIAYFVGVSSSSRFSDATPAPIEDHPQGASTAYIIAEPPAFATPPSNLLSLVLTCRTAHHLLCPQANPRLYARIFKTKFDVDAVRRRFGDEAASSNALCQELIRRCIVLKRIKKAVVAGSLNVPGEGAKAEEDVLTNLWMAYMMMLENDGGNIQQLYWAGIEEYLKLFFEHEMRLLSLHPTYLPETAERALALHLSYLLADPAKIARESKEEGFLRLYMLRPFVFAAHKYDGYYAPWTLRTLPVPLPSTSKGKGRADDSQETGDARMAGADVDDEDDEEAFADAAGRAPDPWLADLRPKVRATTIRHLGRQLRIAPPVLSHAALLFFFMKVEQDPDMAGLALAPENGEEDERNGDATAAPRPRQGQNGRGLAEARRGNGGAATDDDDDDDLLDKRQPLNLRSKDHDKELFRLLSCADPFKSPGLRPSFNRGDFEGNWEGRFTFFDFDSYRDMLRGHISSLYDGPFGEQPQVWKLREHWVKVDRGRFRGRGGGGASWFGNGSGSQALRIEGGNGSVLNAGYQEGEARPEESGATQTAMRTTARRTARASSSEEEGEDGPSEEVDWRSLRLDQLAEGGDLFGEDEVGFDSDDDEEDRHEILLSGTGHSAWGRFVLRGRVRAWDGLISLAKDYQPDARGRWLYRGYVTSGGRLVGRWRDTFTPSTMSGYEGPFLLHRRAD